MLIVFCFSLILSTGTRAQCDSNSTKSDSLWGYGVKEDVVFPGSILSELLTPQIVLDVRSIRAYIVDDRFRTLCDHYGDMDAVDAIFLKSLEITEYNIGRALFISLMAVLEHRNIDVRIPLIGSIDLPLTFEEDSIFSARTRHLPAWIYRNSPKTSWGDRDKLQHFFGSAYLAYSSGEPKWTRMFGDFVEWGETKFIVGGTDDWRDRRANGQGESFGSDLLDEKTLLPSDYLIFLFEEDK